MYPNSIRLRDVSGERRMLGLPKAETAGRRPAVGFDRGFTEILL
jgi:hypothetical protein